MIFIVVLFGCFADTQLALVMGAIWCLFLLGYYRLVVVRARTEVSRSIGSRSADTELNVEPTE